MTVPVPAAITEVMAAGYPPAQVFALPAGAVSSLITSRVSLLYGWWIANTDAAVVHTGRIVDGTDGTGMHVAGGVLPPYAVSGVLADGPGILMRNGIWATKDDAAIELHVFFALL